jgi:2-succinyl-5-enolpyruvyl-6-hydroxy-3-cyclohexene-1-carboxylate synthase
MYSNKENVNILTASLVAHGIKYAVVCPGSRNSPIVHNLNECPDISCYSVTDERSAGFYALGISQALGESVVVCVTSGTALLNLAPAVAEAYYQHISLVVVSADRPPQWIDQLDGQTLPQSDALGRFVKKTVSLPESHNDEERWYCQRLLNEAMLIYDGPIHINVPISEPLFDFTVPELPLVRPVYCWEPVDGIGNLEWALIMFFQAQRPMLVIGQTGSAFGSLSKSDIEILKRWMVVIYEPLSFASKAGIVHFDEVLSQVADDVRYQPDWVMYLGDTIVSKRLRAFLRQSDCREIRVSPDGTMYDTFMHLHTILKCSPESILYELVRVCKNGATDYEGEKNFELRGDSDYQRLWYDSLQRAADHANDYVPAYSQMAVVKALETELQDFRLSVDNPFYKQHVHYANSTAIRLANIYATRYVYCNRGVNGIEGSLSTAAGFSVVCEDDERVLCVIGDLSFFYDSNALWNQNLKGNFRILLLNNGCGGIFNMLRGLEQSPAKDKFVSAEHHTSAEGICRQNDVVYLKATNMEKMQEGLYTLLYIESHRPVLLEVFTDASEDERVFKDYYRRQTHA